LIAFDTETTGFSPSKNRIVEIAIIEYEWLGDDLQEISRWETLVNPELVGDEWLAAASALNVSGLTPEVLEGAPVFKTVLPEIMKHLQRGVLIGHNSGFDMKFLRAEFERAGEEFLSADWPVLDSCRYARAINPGNSAKLRDLGVQYGLNQEGGAAHEASGDAGMTAKLLATLFQQDNSNVTAETTLDTVLLVAGLKDKSRKTARPIQAPPEGEDVGW
jgi:DNA polymerase III epsilon subunit family exonuclease